VPSRRLPPEVIGSPDWHNDLAQFTLHLHVALNRAADERSRKAILRRVGCALGEEVNKEPGRANPCKKRNRR
jgi:hypothetical protein